MGRFLMGMNSIGIIPGHVLNLHPAPLLAAMYRYFHARLLPGNFPLAPSTGPATSTQQQQQQQQPANQPLPATHSLESDESGH